MYLFAIYGWYFYLTWLPTYLLRDRGFDLTHVGWLAALPLLSIAAGVLIGGWLSDVLARRWGARRGRRRRARSACRWRRWRSSPPHRHADRDSSALFFAAAAGLAALGVSPAWAVCLEIGGRHAGVVSGTMNMFGNFGGALSPVVIGFTLERWGTWKPSLLSIAVCYLLAAGCGC